MNFSELENEMNYENGCKLYNHLKGTVTLVIKMVNELKPLKKYGRYCVIDYSEYGNKFGIYTERYCPSNEEANDILSYFIYGIENEDWEVVKIY